jgi:hypothetical protein
MSHTRTLRHFNAETKAAVVRRHVGDLLTAFDDSNVRQLDRRNGSGEYFRYGASFGDR